MVWGGDTAKSWDARQLRQAAGSPSTPYLAMMTATADGSSVSLVASFEGYLGPDRLLQELMLSLERYSRELAPVRERTSQAQRQREQDRRLREEQVRSVGVKHWARVPNHPAPATAYLL